MEITGVTHMHEPGLGIEIEFSLLNDETDRKDGGGQTNSHKLLIATKLYITSTKEMNFANTSLTATKQN